MSMAATTVVTTVVTTACPPMMQRRYGRRASMKIGRTRTGPVQCDCPKLMGAGPFRGALVPLWIARKEEEKGKQTPSGHARKHKARKRRRRPHGTRLRCRYRHHHRHRHRQRISLSLVPPGITPASTANSPLSIHRHVRPIIPIPILIPILTPILIIIHLAPLLIFPPQILTVLSTPASTRLSPRRLIMLMPSPTAILLAHVLQQVDVIKKMLV